MLLQSFSFFPLQEIAVRKSHKSAQSFLNGAYAEKEQSSAPVVWCCKSWHQNTLLNSIFWLKQACWLKPSDKMLCGTSLRLLCLLSGIVTPHIQSRCWGSRQEQETCKAHGHKHASPAAVSELTKIFQLQFHHKAWNTQVWKILLLSNRERKSMTCTGRRDSIYTQVTTPSPSEQTHKGYRYWDAHLQG